MNLKGFGSEKKPGRFQQSHGQLWQLPVDLPQGPVVLLMLIVARGGVKEFSCRFTYFAASAIPEAAQSRSLRASCSDRWFHTHTSVPSALAFRLPPNSPPNPTFAPLAE
jgi:hypothetical protein